MRSCFSYSGWILVALLGTATAALAQTAPPTSTVPPFVIQSDNGDNRLQVGAFVQTDGRFSLNDPAQRVTDTFWLRRLRTIFQGRLVRHVDYFMNVDFAGGVTNIRDAYFDTRFSDAFRVRAGKARVPFSYDRSLLVTSLLFVERGLTTTVAPDRDTGVQVLGDLAGNRISYLASLTNGVIDGGNSDLDSNRNKDVAGKVIVRPWVGHKGHPLAGLSVAVAGNTGVQAGALPSFVSYGRQTFFSYAGATADGRRSRWSPMASFYRGPFGGYAEFVRSHGGIRKAGVHTDVDHDAWQVSGAWVLTGEAASERNVRPKVNFDPPSHHWGAWQVAARYEVLTVSQEAALADLASAGSSREAHATTLGVNWYLNPFVKYNVNIEHTTFSGTVGAAERPAENVVLVRAHLGF